MEERHVPERPCVQTSKQGSQARHAWLASGNGRLLWPRANRATKVVLSIIPNEHAEPSEMHDWQIEHGDVRKNPQIAVEMLAFMEAHGVKSTVMTDGLLGCPHQEGIEYEGQWCPDPACRFWHGRDRFTHKLMQ